MHKSTRLFLSAFVLAAASAAAAEPELTPRVRGVYISTGDNHWLGQSIAVDTPASIEAAFDMFKHAMGAERVYWRGLQEATTLETLMVRPENFRYATAVRWFQKLLDEGRLEEVAADIAHAKGLEFWGVGTLGDWGNQADVPGFNDFPWFWESTLRLENPEWVPVDKYGYRRQGGTIELAYPEARKALVDLHVKLAKRNRYDGIIFLTYVENFSQRFQDEFGYSEPVVQDFKRRYGIDIRTQPFTRFASRSDWYRLRGEYVTAYLRELKEALEPLGVKLGMFINPRTPRKPMVWATLPHEYWTLGNIHFDIDTWVRDGIVDELNVYGNSSGEAQMKTMDDLLWLTRGTETEITFTTSGLHRPGWRRYYELGLGAVYAHGEDHWHLLGGILPEQAADVLEEGGLYERMRFLSQVIAGQSESSYEAILPFTQHDNVMMRRLALHALGKTGDPRAPAVLEAALFDPEIGVRGKAMQALRDVHRPESTAVIIEAVAACGNHPLHEMARDTLPAIRPAPRDELIEAALNHPSAVARTTALRALWRLHPRPEEVPAIGRAMQHDPDDYARFAAAQALSNARNNPEAAHLLLATLCGDDAVTAGRAAASLAALLQGGGERIEALRPELLAALGDYFALMGEGYDRRDAEWGYRTAGDALLAFGEEGERVLEGFVNQEDDLLLSERAWRVLSFREKLGENYFNVITERESEETFRTRPRWMQRLEVERMRQGFENTGVMPDDASGTRGDIHSAAGRWNTFGPLGPYLDRSQARGGARSVALVRGGTALHGWTAARVAADRDFEVRAWVRRGPEGSFILNAQTPQRGVPASARIAPDGSLSLRGPDNEWQPTGLTLPEGEWVQLILRGARAAGLYSAALVNQAGEETPSALSVPLAAEGELYLLQFNPQGRDGTLVHIDDVELIERR